MTLAQLPHELQVHTFRYLKNDVASLCALTLVCKHLFDCAFEVLTGCRTFDLWQGFTDEAEPVLIDLYTLAVAQADFKGTISSLRNNVIKQASRYNTLLLNFDDRRGLRSSDSIESESMAKLEKMWKAVAGIDRFSIQTWRERMKGRCADTSVRVVLRTMQDLTVLELGGCTDVLHWRTEGILDRLHTLRFNSIINSKLSAACCRLATKPQLTTLEFSHMTITKPFLQHLKHPLSITSLEFNHCWVSLPAVRLALVKCQNLQRFVYTIDASKWPADATARVDHHFFLLLGALENHADTLKHITLLMPTIEHHPGQCHHIASLNHFTSLQTLVISYHTLAPHTTSCNIGYAHKSQTNAATTAFDILSQLAPSLRELHLHRGDELSVLQTLSDIADNVGPTMLPRLRYVEVTLAKLPGFSCFRNKSEREQGIVDKFDRRRVVCRIWRPRSLFDAGGIVRPG